MSWIFGAYSLWWDACLVLMQGGKIFVLPQLDRHALLIPMGDLTPSKWIIRRTEWGGV